MKYRKIEFKICDRIICPPDELLTNGFVWVLPHQKPVYIQKHNRHMIFCVAFHA